MVGSLPLGRIISRLSALSVQRLSHGEKFASKMPDVQYLDMIRMVFNRMGVDWSVDGDDIVVPPNQASRS